MPESVEINYSLPKDEVFEEAVEKCMDELGLELLFKNESCVPGQTDMCFKRYAVAPKEITDGKEKEKKKAEPKKKVLKKKSKKKTKK